MSIIVITVMSVLLVIASGYALSRFLMTDPSFWQGVSKLCYWVLFPVMLVGVLAGADFSGSWMTTLIMLLWSALLLMVIYSLLTGRILGLSGPSTSSLLQGNVRFNTFIGIAIMGDILGLRGIELAALATGILVPTVNVLCVVGMMRLNGTGKDGNRVMKRLIVKELARNPLIIAVALGISINLTGLTIPALIGQTMDLLSRAALPMLLMAVGAGMKFRAISSNWQALLSVLLGKGLIMPAFTLAAGVLVSLPAEVVIVTVMFTALPTAASSYALAQQLKGDIALMADIISVQTLVSLVTLIAWLVIAVQVTGFQL